jgi:hypothetical protein
LAPCWSVTANRAAGRPASNRLRRSLAGLWRKTELCLPGGAQQLAVSRVQNKNKYQTAVLKQQLSRPPFSIDRAEKEGRIVSFSITRPYDLSRKSRG